MTHNRKDMTTNLSFSTAILLVIVSQSFFHNSLTCYASFSHDKTREALEIIIGGGGYASPAQPPECPPPPPPPCLPPASPAVQVKPPPPPPPPPHPHPPPPIYHAPTTRPSPGIEDPSGISDLKAVAGTLHGFATGVGYDPKNITGTWNGDDPCKYRRVVCKPFQNRSTVVGIDLNGGHLNGKDGKPLDLNRIANRIPGLMFFHANSNNLTDVPNNISKVKYLFELDLSNNKLNGSFPKDVLKSPTLTFLDLRYNNLNGTVPPEAFTIYLDVLFLNNNGFTGNLPDNFGKLRALYLTFANNFFTGGIPSSIGNCSETLVEVLFLNNSLSGCLPYEIGKLKHMTVFDTSINKFTGPIPHSFGCLKNLQLLNMSHNYFYGPVPEMVCKLGNLEQLTLNNNYFTQVGPECRKLMMSNKLNVKMNCILDLHDQRTPSECATFFSQHRTCPNERSLQHIPCTIENAETTSMEDVLRPAMAPSPTYAALGIHH